MSISIVPPNSNFDFMRVRRITVTIGLFLIVASIVSLATRGLNFGLDFTGGTLVEVLYADPVEQAHVVEQLEAAGFRNALVQRFSATNLSIRLSPDVAAEIAREHELQDTSIDDRNAAVGQRVLEALTADGSRVSIHRSEYVGPQVGRELAYNGIIAVLVVLTGIMIYIALRFEWKFSVAVVAGEMHDVIVTLGIFSLLGMDFDLTVLAAILAVDGYSVNDKIVISDRIRELFRSTRKATSEQIINTAINQTLARTIMTSFTTLLTVVALFLFGGPALQGFSLALIIGIVVGTLSSIFFACPLLLHVGLSKQDLMPKARDEAELARRP